MAALTRVKPLPKWLHNSDTPGRWLEELGGPWLTPSLPARWAVFDLF